MKKSRIVIAAAALAVFASGCGFNTGGEDSTVSVINATPTPTVAPTPEATPTPVPTETQAPAQTTHTTASGVTIIEQTGTYYATDDINLRSDCIQDTTTWVANITSGTEMTATGASEDGQWLEVTVNGQSGYVSAAYASTTAPTAAQ